MKISIYLYLSIHALIDIRNYIVWLRDFVNIIFSLTSLISYKKMRATRVRHFSTFAVSPETSRAPHGPPRGLVNRYISMGLPPWAAWCHKVNRHSLYRMSDIAPRSFLPRPIQEMDVIWMNERVRERVRTSRKVQNVYRQLKYPYVKTGIHFSNVLDHWVQVPMVEAAMLQIEKEGGIDAFIINRSGQELKSIYGERLRRHILVREKEIKKNFVLRLQAKALAERIEEDFASLRSEEDLNALCDKYGLDKEELKMESARKVCQLNGEIKQ